MNDEVVAQFVAVTGATPDQARQYLSVNDENIEQAVQLYFETGGISLMGSESPTQTQRTPTAPPPESRPSAHEVISIDSDDDPAGEEDYVPEVIRSTAVGASASGVQTSHVATQPLAAARDTSGEDDAAMARRLQEEFYGALEGGSGVDAEGYRAPIARTRETLVGPGSYDRNDANEMRAAVMEQMSRRTRRHQSGRPGIFNQQTTGSTSGSIWDQSEATSNRLRQTELSRATGGASESSKKSTLLAEMFRPPFELMAHLSWDEAREQGKDNLKWILVNVQDSSIFDCQLVNRDLWKDSGIRETIKENFIFMQYSKEDPRGAQYVQYYFPTRDRESSYPHIAIVDPRTGEQVKVWSGPPVPRAMDFLMQLHEFLDRYSLSASAKNPVAKRKPEPKKDKQVDRMTEEEQLEMALQQSLAADSDAGDRGASSADGQPPDSDPDDLTRSVGDLGSSSRAAGAAGIDAEMQDAPTNGNGHPASSPSSSPFSLISSSNPHTEPAADASSTRIQFRHPNGRVVRRFSLADPVRRLYEWLKAAPLEGKEGVEFGLVSMGKNLLEKLEDSVEGAGLKNGTVMIEFMEDS